MASFEVQWKNSAAKELRKLDRQIAPRLAEAARQLADDPYPPGLRKLQGAENTYRIRVGDYRLIYVVDLDSKTVVVVHVRHRSDAYRQ